MLLFLLLLFTILITFNINSFYFLWIFIEINIILFLTFIIINRNFVSIISIKYYLIRSFSSIIFIYFINLNIFNKKIFFVILIINLIIIIKLGFIPFHFWFIDIIINLNWIICFFLSTIQKVIPFFILRYIYDYNLIILIIIFGGFINFLLVYNDILLKKIIGYSSINHITWMLVSILIKFNLWLIYFFNYLYIILILSYIFNKYNLEDIKDIYKIYNIIINSWTLNYIIFFLILSLGGLPPFYGFFLKWYIIEYINYFKINFILIFLIFYSLIFLYYYIRIIFNNIIFRGLNFILFDISVNFNNYLLNFKIINLLYIFFSINLIFLIFWIVY